jgi:hypothetical protein
MTNMTNMLRMPLVAASLTQALGGAAGVIGAIALVIMTAALIAACAEGITQRHVGGVKVSLVIAAVAGLAWVITQAFFTAGGMPTNNITVQNVN